MFHVKHFLARPDRACKITAKTLILNTYPERLPGSKGFTATVVSTSATG
mgnify:FL=1|jgi:hypothetical protein